jgi:hypothetical protein
MEATFDAPWFERMLRKHNHELWIGDAAEIRAAMVRKSGRILEWNWRRPTASTWCQTIRRSSLSIEPWVAENKATQIGGEIVYCGGGHVERDDKVVGEPVHGGVLVQASSSSREGTRCRGEVGENSGLQAVLLFSFDACEVYGHPPTGKGFRSRRPAWAPALPDPHEERNVGVHFRALQDPDDVGQKLCLPKLLTMNANMVGIPFVAFVLYDFLGGRAKSLLICIPWENAMTANHFVAGFNSNDPFRLGRIPWDFDLVRTHEFSSSLSGGHCSAGHKFFKQSRSWKAAFEYAAAIAGKTSLPSEDEIHRVDMKLMKRIKRGGTHKRQGFTDANHMTSYQY